MNDLQELKCGFIAFACVAVLCAILLMFLGGVELTMLLCASLVCASVYFIGYRILKVITEPHHNG